MEKTLNILQPIYRVQNKAIFLQPIYIVMNGCHILKILVRVVGFL